MPLASSALVNPATSVGRKRLDLWITTRAAFCINALGGSERNEVKRLNPMMFERASTVSYAATAWPHRVDMHSVNVVSSPLMKEVWRGHT